MKTGDRLPMIFVSAVVLGGFGAMAWQLFQPSTGATVVSVTVPDLSTRARTGQAAY